MIFKKYALLGFILSLAFLHSTHTMQNDSESKKALIKAIEKDINYFKNANLGVGSVRKAKVTIDRTKYTLTAFKPYLIPDLMFTFECDNKEIENYFKEKLGIT